MNSLVIVLLLSAFGGKAESSTATMEAELPSCPEGLKPTKAPAPSLAGTHHLVFEGNALLEAWVKPSGELANVSLVSSDWKLIRGGNTEAIDRLVVNGIGKWRYPAVSEKCVLKIPFRVVFTD